MASGSGEVRRAIIDRWNESNLDDGYTQWWTQEQIDASIALTLDPPPAGTPFPSCALDFDPGRVVSRMSSDSDFKREVREYRIAFKVYSLNFSPAVLEALGHEVGDPNIPTVAELAQERIEDIIRVYGGHPTESPLPLTIQNGNVLQVRYDSDAIKELYDSENTSIGIIWRAEYSIWVDVPVAVNQSDGVGSGSNGVQMADLKRAINALWDNAKLDEGFLQFWSDGQEDLNPVLTVQRPPADQPFPSCVIEYAEARVQDRMSGALGINQEIRDIKVKFKVFALDNQTLNLSGPEIAEGRIEDIMKVFGGHHTVHPQIPVLENGGVLIFQYENDFIQYLDDVKGYTGVTWELNYNVKADVPIRV